MCTTAETDGPDDDDLVEDLRRGDASSYEILVRRYGGRMLAAARRLLRVEEDAEDAVQEAFLGAFRSIESFRGESALGTWLHRIAVNAALMKLRRASSRPEIKMEDCLPSFDEAGHRLEPPGGRFGSPDSEVLRAETQARVRECIARLPARYAEVVVLREIDELSTEETARVLGITRNAVKVRLHRARQALVTVLKEEFQGEAV